jgi:hypothetical protein
MKLLLANLFWLGRAANDIAFSATKFEAFSTDFAITGNTSGVPKRTTGNLSPMIGAIKTLDMSVSGKLQFDVASKKLKITATTFKASATLSTMGAVSETSSFVSVIDFSAWSASYKVKASVTMMGQTHKTNNCSSSISLPDESVAAVVSLYMSKVYISQYVTMGNMYINTFPHTTADGVATFTKSQRTFNDVKTATVKIKTDGTPVSLLFDNTFSNNTEKGRYSVTFSDWTKSSGDMSAPTCTSSEDAAEFDWNLLGVAEMKNFVQDHPVFREVTETATEMLAGLENDNSDFSTLATVFLVAGVAGAAIVLVVSKFSLKKNKASPLLDEV